MKIIEEVTPVGIPVYDMPDGAIAIITDWLMPIYVGAIVQRVGGILIQLGKGKDDCFNYVISSKSAGCFVRILPPGTKLEI